jgi:hypothetical protein
MKGFLLKLNLLDFLFTRQGGWQGPQAVDARRARHFQSIGWTTKGPIDVFYIGDKNYRAIEWM